MNYKKLQGLIGIPWVYKKSDCWSIFKRGSLELFGVEVHDLSLPDVSSAKANTQVFKSEINASGWVRSESCHAGCAVVFYDRSDDPIHIGLAIDDANVLHSMGASGMNSSSRPDKIKFLLKHRFFSKCEFYDYSI